MTRMTEIYRSVAFAAAAAALVFGATPAKADALPLQGIVAVACTISTADAGAGTLDLSTSKTAVTIANVTEDCNDSNGYTVTVATTNGAALTTGLLVSQNVNGANATDLTYSIKYDTVAVTLTSGSGTAATRSSFTNSQTVALAITYTSPGGGLPADTYTDTLTLTISAS